MLTNLFWNKIKLEMRLLHIVEHQPSSRIKLEPLSENDFIISQDVVQAWSPDNLQLYQLLLQNGMAEFICNRDFLFEFYRSLLMEGQNLSVIDAGTLRFSNLQTLNLVRNNITSLDNIPRSCKELYLDFNQLGSIELTSPHRLELLSVSHNLLQDSCLQSLPTYFPSLKCLNLSHNSLSDLRNFVISLAGLSSLKILLAFSNPFSILPVYYSYITDHIPLVYFDGTKYIKEEPQKVQSDDPERKELKEEKKDPAKKDPVKKDSKKTAKIEEKPVEEPFEVREPPQIVKRTLTESDFTKFKLQVHISNIEEHGGRVFDSGLFPADTDVNKMQTCFWVQYEVMAEGGETKETMMPFDESTSQNNEIRLNLKCEISKQFSLNKDTFLLFNKGFRASVMQREPKMIQDPDTLELKPKLREGEPVMLESTLGAIHVDFRDFHLLKEKIIRHKYRLFDIEGVKSPLFYDPLENQSQLISQKKNQFEERREALQKEVLQKKQEDEQLLSQKKGKDQKKGDKKASKKEGKESITEKVKSEACSYAVEPRLYSIVENGKMFKGKELLCLQICIG